MAWFIPLYASLCLTCGIVWMLDKGRWRRLVSEMAALWRRFSRGQAVVLCVLVIWAVAYGGSKSTNDAPENAQSGIGAVASGVSSNSTSVGSTVAASTYTNSAPASSAPVDGVPASTPATEVVEAVSETETTVHAGDPVAQQSPLMAPEGPLWSTFEYPSWPFDAFTSNAIVGMAATACPPIPDVMLASGLALHRVTTNTVLVADTGAAPVRAWLNHGADNRGVFVDAPFAITLGTNSYTRVGILANGRLAFGYATYHRQTAAGLPFETPYPVVTVAPLWGPFALLPSAGSVAWTRTIAPDRFIVGWENLLLDGDPAQPATAQCEIRSDGTIRFLYGTLAEGVPAASTVGLQNLGTGWVYSHGHTNRLLSGMTVSLRPVGLDGWAEADPDSDLLSNFDEFMLGTDPVLADTDSDGPSDMWELTHGFDPVVAQLAPPDSDFDGDKIPDRWETWMETVTNNVLSGVWDCQDEDGDGFTTWYENHVSWTAYWNPNSPGPPDADHTDVMAVVTSSVPCVLRLSGGGTQIEVPWMPGVSSPTMRLRLVRGQEYEAMLSRVPSSEPAFTTDGFWWADLAFAAPGQVVETPMLGDGTVSYNAGTVHITGVDRAGETWLVSGVAASPTNHVDAWRIAVDGPFDFCHESTYEQIPLAAGSLVADVQWLGLPSGTTRTGKPLEFNPSEVPPGSYTVTVQAVDNPLVCTNFTVRILHIGVAQTEAWISANDTNLYHIGLSSNTYPTSAVSVWSEPEGIDSLTIDPGTLEPGSYTVYLSQGQCDPVNTTVRVFGIGLDNGLWWFNGAEPGNGYHTSAVLTAMGAEEGYFGWQIVRGADKVDLDGGLAGWGDTAILHNQPSVAIRSKAPSAAATSLQTDVTIRLRLDGVPVCDYELVVLAPHNLVWLRNNDQASTLGYGYSTWVHYRIEDQFGDTLPYSLGVNEDWTGPLSYEYQGANWGRRAPGGEVVDPADWTDNITGAYQYDWIVPQSVAPTNTAAGVGVVRWPGKWYVGSTTNGLGVPVGASGWAASPTCEWHLYRGKARHE